MTSTTELPLNDKTVNHQIEHEKPLSFSDESVDSFVGVLQARGLFSKNKNALTRTTDGSYSYVTSTWLSSQFQKLLECHGRLDLVKAATSLRVGRSELDESIVAYLTSDPSLYCVGSEVITRDFLEKEIEGVFERLQIESDGIMSISAISRMLRLPFEIIREEVEKRLPGNIHLRSLDSGSDVLVSNEYVTNLKASLQNLLACAEEPVHLSAICKLHDWQLLWVRDFAVESLNDESLSGELHGDFFSPSVHLEHLHETVLSAFATVGVVSTATQRSMSFPEICDCVLHKFESVSIVLKNCIVHRDVVVGPMEAAIQETDESRGWLNLMSLLPMEIFAYPDDAETIVFEHVLNSVDSSGIAVVQSDGGIYLSPSFVKSTSTDLLPTLVEKYAKSQADHLDKIEEGATKSEPNSKPKSAKMKGQGRMQREASNSCSTDAVPVDAIVAALVKREPSMGEIAEENPSLLTTVCLKAYHTSDHLTNCARAVKAELARIQTAREVASRSQRGSAVATDNVERSFEATECFSYACYSIQVAQKFLKYACEMEPEESFLDTLTCEILAGPCAHFTSRITQYCLFKVAAERDGTEGTFVHSDLTGDMGSKQFYDPVAIASANFRPVQFSFEPNDPRSKISDPLPALRKVLPGNSGVSLARQWKLCGGSCYKGGDRTKSGDLEAFLVHVEENCLSICGLPFKKLDKKAEKKFLYARREQILYELETSLEPGVILELTVMVLFQLFKNLVVSGSLLRGPILALLKKERKMTPHTSDALSALSVHIEEGTKPNVELVETVRSIGLNRAGKK